MSKIQVLDKHTAELIAAGEVVERPSSVVKELLENTIDAGATNVTLEIRNGGVSFLSVSDNGSGIQRDDVPTAFYRHATSKVHTEEDLEAIGTLGFRGEALASIAAVSRVELLTCAQGEELGTLYRLEGGEEVSCEDAGRAVGTTITVRDLFYNVPARMKFLKKDVSEGNAVAGVVDRIALSHPEVSFRFVREGREELLTPGDGDIRSCIYAVFGKDFSESLLPVDYSYGGVRVGGFISRPVSSRANRTMQHFFVNGRYVKTRTAMAALEQAFKGSIMIGKFPACVLYIEMPPETVDANVHPAKIEVRFAAEKTVFDAVYHGVKSALETGDSRKQAVLPVKIPMKEPAPEQLKLHEEATARTRAAAVLSHITDDEPVVPISSAMPAKAEQRTPPPAQHSVRPPLDPLRFMQPAGSTVVRDATTVSTYGHAADINIVRTEPAVKPPAEPEPPAAEEAVDDRVVTYIGEVYKTYILAELGGSLFFIDKHAAHERILYNELKSAARQEAQQLLLPVSVPLSKEEYTVITNELEALSQAGFEVEDFGGSTVLVRGIPMMLSDCDVAAAIQEIAGGLVSGRREIAMDKLDWIYHSTACRAAVKGGDHSSPEELAVMARRVLLQDDIRYCPHGRPVCFELTRKELEKQFGRIV